MGYWQLTARMTLRFQCHRRLKILCGNLFIIYRKRKYHYFLDWFPVKGLSLCLEIGMILGTIKEAHYLIE